LASERDTGDWNYFNIISLSQINSGYSIPMYFNYEGAYAQ
jgi:hypothetical protein